MLAQFKVSYFAANIASALILLSVVCNNNLIMLFAWRFLTLSRLDLDQLITIHIADIYFLRAETTTKTS